MEENISALRIQLANQSQEHERILNEKLQEQKLLFLSKEQEYISKIESLHKAVEEIRLLNVQSKPSNLETHSPGNSGKMKLTRKSRELSQKEIECDSLQLELDRLHSLIEFKTE